ncbi:MAG TPA: hypothetical protein VGE72_23970 [Azospirillum sp.]
MPATTFRIIANLLPVGPHVDPRTADTATLALQLAGSYDAEPDAGSFDGLAHAACPWNFIADDVRLTLACNVTAAGATQTDVRTVAPLPLMARQMAEPLASRFERRYCIGPQAETAVDLAYAVSDPSAPAPGPAGTEQEVYRLAELLFYLSTLPGRVANSLRATLYVTVDLAVLRQAHWDMGPLVLLPAVVRRGAVGTETATPRTPPGPLTAAPTVFGYDGTLGGLNVELVTLPCQLTTQEPPKNGLEDFSFKSYWLEAPKVLEDSWLDALDHRLRGALDPPSVVTSVSFDEPSGNADPATLDAAWGTAALASLLVDTLPWPSTDVGESPILLDHLSGAAARLAGLLQTADGPFGVGAADVLAAAFDELNAGLTLDAWHEALLRHAGMPIPGDRFPGGAAVSAWQRSRLTVAKQVRGDTRLYHGLPYLLWRMALAQAHTTDPQMTARRRRMLQALDSLPAETARTAVSYGVPLPERRRVARQHRLLSAIGQDANPSTTARGKVRAAVAHLLGRVESALVRLGAASRDLEMVRPVLSRLPDDYLGRVWPQAAAAAAPDPVRDLDRLPRGIRIQLGDPRAEDAPGAAADEALRQLAGLGLAVRRHSGDGIRTGEWRIVTSGSLWTADDRAGGEEPGVRLADRVVVPYRLAHLGGLTRPEIVYRGALVGIDDPLAGAVSAYRLHEAERAAPGAGGLTDERQLIHYRQPLRTAAGTFDVMRAPPLRYGDRYELAVFGIGSAGGLPPEIADRDAPYEPSPAKGWAPRAEAVVEDIYQRTVAVGPVSFNPEQAANAEFWPKPPDGVSLRLYEILRETPADGAGVAAGRPPVAFLTPGTAEFRTDLKPDFRFLLTAPGIDPRTLQEWCTPPLPTDPAGQAAVAGFVKRLEQALTLHFDCLNAAEANLAAPLDRIAGDGVPLLADPAVAAIGVRAWLWNESTHSFVLHPEGAVLPLTYATGADDRRTAFTALPVPAEIRCAATATPLSLDDGGGTRLSIRVAPGRIVRIECHALLRAEDRGRFTDKALAALRPPTADDDVLREWERQGYTALPGSAFAVETARAVSVDALTLWKALRVEEKGDFVELSVGRAYNGAPLFGADPTEAAETLALFSRYEIEVERWVWRGQPVIVPPRKDKPTIGGAFGEPPPAVYRIRTGGRRSPMPQEERDGDGDILLWEAVAAVGGRFLGRPTIAGLLPRGTAGGEGPIVLALDPQENFRGRSYRRYALRLESRYRGALARPAEGISRMDGAAGLERWRRIITAHRAGRPQPPKILAVLPLTRGLDEFPARPRENLAAAAPQLVIVDEIPYREHGIGDAVLAHVVEDRVNMVPGGAPAGDAPWLIGPAPDSYWSADNVGPLDPDTVFPRRAGDPPPALKVVGPFGHTFDTSDVDPGINAASYVVLPPDGIGPRWFAAVSFFRAVRTCEADPVSGTVGYQPQDGKTSEGTAPMPLFFTGGAFELPAGADGTPVRLTEPRLNRQHQRIEYDPTAFFVLHPTASAAGLARIPAGRDPAAATHRYFILLTQVVADQTGEWFDPRGQEATPERALAIFRIDPATGSATTADPLEGFDAEMPLRGRVIEVELNGRYTQTHLGENPLLATAPPAMRVFWRALMPNSEAGGTDQILEAKPLAFPDAHGTVRRVSESFAVVP